MKQFAILMLAATLCASAAHARKHGKKGPGGGGNQMAVTVFAPGQAQIIREYCAHPVHHHHHPHHHGRHLPPGLAKQLRRNGRLPPGLDQHWVVFPADLDRQLPPLPPGYLRVFVDNRAMVVDSRRGVVIDMIAAF